MFKKSRTKIFEREAQILLWGSNLWNFANGMLGPLFAVFAARIGGDILDISWAWALYLAVMGVCTIAVGAISDVVSKEKLLLLGYAMTTFFTFSYLTISTPTQLFLVQAGLGVAIALSNPTWYALYAKYSSVRREGYRWGLADGAASIVTAVGILIGGLIVELYSFEALFITMGIVNIIATIYQAQILRR